MAEGLVQAALRLAILTTMALLYTLWLYDPVLAVAVLTTSMAYTLRLYLHGCTVQAALRLGSTDNVTVLVIWLVWQG